MSDVAYPAYFETTTNAIPREARGAGPSLAAHLTPGNWEQSLRVLLRQQTTSISPNTEPKPQIWLCFKDTISREAQECRMQIHYRHIAQLMDSTPSGIKKSTILSLPNVFKVVKGRALEKAKKEGHASISLGSGLPGSEIHV